jgi:hypothetical protein
VVALALVLFLDAVNLELTDRTYAVARR